MKKYNSYYIDEFILEKYVNQWISKKMLKNYYTVFNMLVRDKNIIASNLSTYNARNFKKISVRKSNSKKSDFYYI